MLHAVIIDDEYNGVRSLELLVKRFVPDLKIVASCTNPLEGIEVINNFRPDIVFLDINMPVLNGFQLLENLDYKSFHLIFTTAHSQFGLKALKQNATGYLLKPIDIEELKQAIENVKQKTRTASEQPSIEMIIQEMKLRIHPRVPLPVKNQVEYVPGNRILYIEANSNNCRVALDNNEVMHVIRSLKDFEALLCNGNTCFLRIHNSFIINLSHVTRYLREDGGYAVVGGKKTIPISKSKKNEFLKAINLTPES